MLIRRLFGALVPGLVLAAAACRPAATTHVDDRGKPASASASVTIEKPAPAMPTDAREDAKQAVTDWSAFKRDQRPLSGLTAWRGGAAVRSTPFMAIDAAHGTASPIVIAGCADILDVGSDGARDVAVCVDVRGGVRVFDRDARGLSMHPLDGVTGATAKKTPLRVATAGATIVVWEPTRLHVKRGTEPFHAVALKPLPDAPRGIPIHVRAIGDRLYLGSSSGEWGGALVSIDLASGEQRIEPGDTMTTQPVMGLATDRDGKLWVARGLSHLGANQGSLHALDGAAFRLVAGSPGGWGGPKLPVAEWNLPQTAFAGVAFDARGTLYLATEGLGLVRHEAGGGFTRLMPDWPKESLYVNGLVIHDDVALIGTFDAGIIAFDLTRGTVTRIAIGAR